MVTLHAYILRELLKAFGLTVLALTALFTMGGGLYNILKFEGVSATDLFSVLPLMIPVAVTITMPVAAIFAATITYGRLAADNELVACRAVTSLEHRLERPVAEPIGAIDLGQAGLFAAVCAGIRRADNQRISVQGDGESHV